MKTQTLKLRGRAGRLPAMALTACLFIPLAPHAAAAPVKVSEQNIVIPTYLAGEPEPNPMFYFGRGSQGAEGRVYPYPLYDTLTNIKSNKTYKIVYLENEYVRIGILPEIGGRLFEAVDKSNNYDFIYRQHVIKPQLIGLIGAWISGGIEWNIPHHHRASTFIPVQYHTEENADGSKTIWVGELEVRHRMRWAVGYTLSPGKSYLTAKVRILNRTPFVNTMLCFANVAVHANENYQVIYPPSTELVTFHSKREFANWPIATTRYNGADFTRGVDVSWYSNHIAANSMFAWNYEDDFFAGYDHGRQVGILSVADHHVVPGKKFWTWGNGARGKMWDKNLTDNDGPYIELMVGAYSDNQPDYTWLQPFETRSFEMHWYPFRDIGGVKQANLDAAVNLDVTKGVARIGFCTTEAHRSATALVKAGDKVLLEEKIAINPGKPFVKQISIPAGVDEHDLRASLSVDGRELVAYSPVRLKHVTMPEVVTPPPAPAEIKAVEELYLAGQRIDQFHNPSLEPEPYWEEALRRDPGDARVNTSLGILKLRQARFAEAEQLFRKALERITAKFTTPKDGEAFYYLGLALKAQEKSDEAFDAFFKATWSEAWRSPAYFSLAEIATRRGDFTAALAYSDRSLDGNGLNVRALNLKAAVLRHLGRAKEALAVLDIAATKTDPLDVRLMTERWLAGEKGTLTGELSVTLRDHPNTGLETAAEFGNAGLWQDGIKILTLTVDSAKDRTRIPPLTYYYLGHFSERLGDAGRAAEYRQLATKMSPDYVFPFQWEAIHVLRQAMKANPHDARAPYYLGNLLFDWQPEEAVKLWEQSAALDPSFPIVHRNLAVAYSHQGTNSDNAKAIAQLEQAVASPVKYPMHFAELDALYANAGAPPEKRLALLEQNQNVVLKRDDALSHEIGMKVFAGKYDEAIRLMTGRKFAVWEGGNLDVAEHWVNARLLRGQRQIAAKQFAAALADFQAAKTIPENLPSDRGVGGRDAEFAYWIGIAQEGMGDLEKAKQSWQEAVSASADTGRFGGRGQGRVGGGGGRGRGGAGGGGGFASDRGTQRYYQALAQRKLGQNEQAETLFRELVTTGTEALQQIPAGSDSVSGFGERQAPRIRLAQAHYSVGLGQLGLGEFDKARSEFTAALAAAPDHLGAKTALTRYDSTAVDRLEGRTVVREDPK